MSIRIARLLPSACSPVRMSAQTPDAMLGGGRPDLPGRCVGKIAVAGPMRS
jgi:hypothetical protein